MYKSYDELGSQPDERKDAYDVLEIQDGMHRDTILKTHRLVCIDVYSDWCQPCKITAPDYSMLASKYNSENEVVMVKENYEKQLTRVEVLPTFVIYLDGQIVDQIIGAEMAKIEASMRKYIQMIRNVGNQPYTTVNYASTASGPQYMKNTIRNGRPSIPNTTDVGPEYNTAVNSLYKGNEAVYYTPYRD